MRLDWKKIYRLTDRYEEWKNIDRYKHIEIDRYKNIEIDRYEKTGRCIASFL